MVLNVSPQPLAGSDQDLASNQQNITGSENLSHHGLRMDDLRVGGERASRSGPALKKLEQDSHVDCVDVAEARKLFFF